jgi:hypothetical protein
MTTIASRRRQHGYLLDEALVYISVVFVLLGVGYLAMYRCIDHSIALRRSADDIAAALRAGERWRADVRAATLPAQVQFGAPEQIVHLDGKRGPVDYRYSEGGVYRRLGEAPWVCLLSNVRESRMEAEARSKVTVWRWELELQPRSKGAVKASRVRTLFTFLAVAQNSPRP